MIAAPCRADIVSLDDEALAEVSGQALFNAQKITGGPQGFTFYRLMVDAQLDLNMNIDSLKLGCGGVNNNLRTDACDIDLQQVVLMGRNGDNPGAVGSDFTLKRPYLEFAIKNDGNKATREVIGIKIGSQEANGFMGIGHEWPNGHVDPTTGATCDNGASKGNAALACHNGINAISGFLRADMSATAVGSGYLVVFFQVNFDFIGCFGNTIRTDDLCSATAAADNYTTNIVGTRMTDVAIANKTMKTQTNVANISVTAKADILESLRFLHEIVLANTQNFGLSFQREQVQYPNFNPATYAAMANTGFWFNIPAVRIRDGFADVGYIGDAGPGFGAGLNLQQIDLGQVPPDNCFGSTKFC